jgi:hypothetical protein
MERFIEDEVVSGVVSVRSEFMYVGFGEGDDAGWFECAIQNGFAIRIVDFLPLALRNAQRYMEELKRKMRLSFLPVSYQRRDYVTAIDQKLEKQEKEGWENKKDYLFMCRLLENDPNVEVALGEIGKLLKMGMELVIVHPFGEDNPSYISAQRSNGTWHSTAYTRAQILEYLCAGLGREPQIARQCLIPFYDRNYTICVITI